MTERERIFEPGDADKLDNPERRAWLPVDDVLRALDLRPGERVADVGAGTGYFALPMALAVGPAGRVAAIDVQKEMLALLRRRVPPGANVDIVEADALRTTLADGSRDLALVANVWHELDDRDAVLAEMARVLAPGGRLAILDWRADVGSPPGPPAHHRVPEADVAAALRGRGWTGLRAAHVGPFSYLIVANRPR
jgi:ubiquinone/menaquinone biosynthesis C-methylase UbiE